MNDAFTRNRHGSLYDRGAADSYYNRPRDPHWYPLGSYNSPKITELTAEEIAEYHVGYDENEQAGSHKEW
jgi:hypothetical protein